MHDAAFGYGTAAVNAIHCSADISKLFVLHRQTSCSCDGYDSILTAKFNLRGAVKAGFIQPSWVLWVVLKVGAASPRPDAKRLSLDSLDVNTTGKVRDSHS